MTSEPCDGCGRDVRIAGGVENIWTLEGGATKGMTIDLDDGEFFLCFECIERLPEEPTAEDVAALPEREEPIDRDGQSPAEPPRGPGHERSSTEAIDDDGGVRYVVAGLALGAVVGAILGWHFEDTGFWFSLGMALGFAAGLIGGRIAELRAERNDRSVG